MRTCNGFAAAAARAARLRVIVRGAQRSAIGAAEELAARKALFTVATIEAILVILLSKKELNWKIVRLPYIVFAYISQCINTLTNNCISTASAFRAIFVKTFRAKWLFSKKKKLVLKKKRSVMK